MHMVIRIIVPANSKESALDKAKSILEDMSGEGKDFDYYQTFDTEGTPCSGKGRYGAVPAVLKVKTKAGLAMVADGLDATKREFMDNLARIRAGLQKHTDEEIFNESNASGEPDTDLFLVRHAMYNAGKYGGSSCWLYDQYGSGIRHQKDLDRALETKGIATDEELYVVPADVHF